MTTPDRHPERIAATVRENNTLRGYRYTTHGDADANGNRVYVREDVAALDTQRAVDNEARARAAEEETTALRRERDALAARLFAEERRVAALREGLRVIVMRSLASVDDPSVEVMAYEIANHALMLDSDMMADSDEAAAGKGVG